jgi:5-methylcytosine-specific restriction endonuclease McrBC regulatory subunit McrC
VGGGVFCEQEKKSSDFPLTIFSNKPGKMLRFSERQGRAHNNAGKKKNNKNTGVCVCGATHPPPTHSTRNNNETNHRVILMLAHCSRKPVRKRASWLFK